MTKDVWVRICGRQTIEGETGEPIEVIVPGMYYQKKEKHYLFYDEIADEEGGVTRNRVVIAPSYINIVKKGLSNVEMTYEPGVSHRSNYQTPYGVLNMNFTTEELKLDEGEDRVLVSAKYHMDLNGEPYAKCTLELEICSKDKCTFQLI